jgi:predicted nuclease of predicted toxin-antitoxin system
MKICVDENIPLHIVEELRNLGHDVLDIRGTANQGISDEVLFATMERQGLLHTPNAVALIKNLATADFERTVNLTNRFTRPEIRIFARLKMAEALLDPDAAEIEKQLRQQYENEHDH